MGADFKSAPDHFLSPDVFPQSTSTPLYAGTSGGSYAADLQLREPPSGSRVHAVIGGRETQHVEEEKTLIRMAERRASDFAKLLNGMQYQTRSQ